jgi:hypothetical protein
MLSARYWVVSAAAIGMLLATPPLVEAKKKACSSDFARLCGTKPKGTCKLETMLDKVSAPCRAHLVAVMNAQSAAPKTAAKPAAKSN